jgi:hypothetical protein
LASNKVCHTLSSSQRTHTHQHHPTKRQPSASTAHKHLETATHSGATTPA